MATRRCLAEFADGNEFIGCLDGQYSRRTYRFQFPQRMESSSHRSRFQHYPHRTSTKASVNTGPGYTQSGGCIGQTASNVSYRNQIFKVVAGVLARRAFLWFIHTDDTGVVWNTHTLEISRIDRHGGGTARFS